MRISRHHHHTLHPTRLTSGTRFTWPRSRPTNRSTWLLSLAAHATLIATAVVSTRARVDVPEGSVANRVYYIPPPPRTPEGHGPREHLVFVELPLASGTGFTAVPSARPHVRGGRTSSAGEQAPLAEPNRSPVGGETARDSVYTNVQVDSVAVRDASSAAPQFPIEMLHRGIEGRVATSYVVDTTGVADTATLIILSATAPAFATAVRAALPGMRFSPARINGRAVRQLVGQEFTFLIRGALRDSVGRTQAITSARPPLALLNPPAPDSSSDQRRIGSFGASFRR